MRRERTQATFLLLVGVGFGYCEAATVAYIRLLGEIARGSDYAQAWAARGLPLTGATILSELRRMSVLPVEWGREAATLLVLCAASLLAGATRRDRLAAFVLCFAAWDLSYYAWLRLFCGFPSSLAQTDIYFLLPVPTYGPVWLPLAIMGAALIWSLRRMCQGERRAG